MTVELRVFIEPQQGASYDDQLAVARRAEECGFGAFFRSDHFLFMGDRDPRPGPTDSYVTLAGIARETNTIRLGTLVTSATFRDPGLLAVQVAQVDQMSGGRLELGLGAGWFEREHEAYGFAFPPTRERFDRLEEQLEIVTGMHATPEGQTYSFTGRHYRVVDSPALPKPVQERVPVLVGGHGKKRTPALAARFASEFNVPFGDLDGTAAQFRRVVDACAATDRPAGDLVLSAAQTVCVGRDDAEVARRADAAGRQVDELVADALGGTPAQVVDRIGRFAEAGATRVYVQVLDLHDLDHLDLIASEVASQV
ncbi:LLM class F420-dependent oxidoreductase [Angustibacter speluncae]